MNGPVSPWASCSKYYHCQVSNTRPNNEGEYPLFCVRNQWLNVLPPQNQLDYKTQWSHSGGRKHKTCQGKLSRWSVWRNDARHHTPHSSALRAELLGWTHKVMCLPVLLVSTGFQLPEPRPVTSWDVWWIWTQAMTVITCYINGFSASLS